MGVNLAPIITMLLVTILLPCRSELGGGGRGGGRPTALGKAVPVGAPKRPAQKGAFAAAASDAHDCDTWFYSRRRRCLHGGCYDCDDCRLMEYEEMERGSAWAEDGGRRKLGNQMMNRSQAGEGRQAHQTLFLSLLSALWYSR